MNSSPRRQLGLGYPLSRTSGHRNIQPRARVWAVTRKSLTISVEAYNALARTKGKDESFTKVILRLTRKKAAGNLLDYVRSMLPNEELASAIEKVLERRGKIRLRTPQF